MTMVSQHQAPQPPLQTSGLFLRHLMEVCSKILSHIMTYFCGAKSFLSLNCTLVKSFLRFSYFMNTSIFKQQKALSTSGLFLYHLMEVCTLTCQIIVQDHLIVQVPDFSEIDKRVGPNKAMQVGFFLFNVGENQILKGNFKN